MYFLTGLSSCDPNFPIGEWGCCLLAHTDIQGINYYNVSYERSHFQTQQVQMSWGYHKFLVGTVRHQGGQFCQSFSYLEDLKKYKGGCEMNFKIVNKNKF